jgi:hypothetical protein
MCMLLGFNFTLCVASIAREFSDFIGGGGSSVLVTAVAAAHTCLISIFNLIHVSAWRIVMELNSTRPSLGGDARNTHTEGAERWNK